jgi:hypothetical protein
MAALFYDRGCELVRHVLLGQLGAHRVGTANFAVSLFFCE